MRALVALVTCVILLAIIQGSYLVIDAHTNPQNVRHDVEDSHREHHGKEAEHHGKHSSQSDHNNEHQSNHHDHYHSIPESHHGNRGILSKDGLKEDKVETPQSGCQGNKCINSQKETEIELIPLEIQGNGTGKHRILYQTLHVNQQQQQQPQQQQQQHIPYKHVPDESQQQREGQGHQNRSHHPPYAQNVHGMSHDPNSKPHEPQGDRLLLEGMQGDMSLADNRIKEHFLLDDPVRHQRDKSRTRGKRKECVSHDGCEMGDCCLTRHKGPSYCATSKKEAGSRCVDSCTCQQGLQCFVAKVNKFGRPRRRNGVRPLLGICQDPNVPTSLPGYWATYRPNSEASSIEITSAPFTSTTPPRSRSSFLTGWKGWKSWK